MVANYVLFLHAISNLLVKQNPNQSISALYLLGIKIHFGYSPISCSPVFAIVTQATDSERAFVLTDNDHDGILYICDKGYISEKLWADIHNRGNFFIMKGFKNMAAEISVGT